MIGAQLDEVKKDIKGNVGPTDQKEQFGRKRTSLRQKNNYFFNENLQSYLP